MAFSCFNMAPLPTSRPPGRISKTAMRPDKGVYQHLAILTNQLHQPIVSVGQWTSQERRVSLEPPQQQHTMTQTRSNARSFSWRLRRGGWGGKFSRIPLGFMQRAWTRTAHLDTG
jgi:hypothetical protein